MHAKKTFGIIIVAFALVIILYDVQVNFVFSLPSDTQQYDSVQEALYAECYESLDEQLHDTAFGTIDNPDVQKEYINTGRVRAATKCRDEYPQQWVTMRQPLQMNLLDLQPRYW